MSRHVIRGSCRLAAALFCLAWLGAGPAPSAPAPGATAAPAARPEFAYVLTRGEFLRQYRVGEEGALVPLDPPKVRAGPGASFLAAHPRGVALYVVAIDYGRRDGKRVLQYRIDPQSGRLALLAPPSVPAPRAHGGLVFHPNGRVAYVLDEGGVQAYRIDPKTGALAPLGKPTAVGGDALAITPDGRFAYAVDGSIVRQFRVGGDGRLRPLRRDYVSGVKYGSSLAVAPGGRFVYVVGGRSLDSLGADTRATEEDSYSLLAGYRIRPDGTLAPLKPASIRTGSGASEVRFGADPKTVYVWNETNLSPDAAVWTRYTLRPDGTLLRVGPVGDNDPALVRLRGRMAASGRWAYAPSDGSLDAERRRYRVNADGTLAPLEPPLSIGGGVRDMVFARP